MYIDRTGESRQRSRASQKRTWLTNLLSLGAGVTVSVVGSVAHCHDGGKLPTRVDSANPVVRSNPFVASPTAPTASVEGEIKQTSEIQFSELQLKSIGTAVGLVPIGKPRPTQPVLEVSKPGQAKVRVNPLASKPAGNFELPVIGLVEDPSGTPSTPKQAALPAKRSADATPKSRTRILGLRYVESATPDVLPTAPAETEVMVGETTSPTQNSSVEVIETSETVVASTVEDEPTGFSFSFSDQSDDNSDEGRDEAASAKVSSNEAVAEVAEPAEGFLIPPPEEVSFHRDPTELVQAVGEDSQESGDHAAIDLLPLLPIPNPAWTEHPNTDVSVAGNDSTVIRYPERRKAHVEVASPPMISFHSKSKQESKTVSGMEATRIVPAKLARFRVASGDPSPMDSSEKRIEGATEQPTEKVTEQKPVDPIAVLDAKIRKSYPTAILRISQVKGKMLVRGISATQEDATEIIRMIRNEFLVPVDDQIVIR